MAFRSLRDENLHFLDNSSHFYLSLKFFSVISVTRIRSDILQDRIELRLVPQEEMAQRGIYFERLAIISKVNYFLNEFAVQRHFCIAWQE